MLRWRLALASAIFYHDVSVKGRVSGRRVACSGKARRGRVDFLGYPSPPALKDSV